MISKLLRVECFSAHRVSQNNLNFCVVIWSFFSLLPFTSETACSNLLLRFGEYLKNIPSSFSVSNIM